MFVISLLKPVECCAAVRVHHLLLNVLSDTILISSAINCVFTLRNRHPRGDISSFMCGVPSGTMGLAGWKKCLLPILSGSWIAHSVYRLARDPANRVVWALVPVGSRIVFLHIVQTASEANATSYLMDTWATFVEIKWPENESDHLPLTTAEVKRTCSHKSLPACIFMV
jgi:hypothetical protein